MKTYEIDYQARRFKENGNAEFLPLIEHYKKTCYLWYRYVYRKTRVDRDEFYGQFTFLLYRSLLKYDPEYKQVFEIAQSKFDRYFLAAVRKLAVTHIRNAARQGRKPKRYNIDEIPLTMPTDYFEEVYMEDFIAQLKDPVDREIVRMRVFGNSREDVCSTLGIKLHEYRASLKRIKMNPVVVSLLVDT